MQMAQLVNQYDEARIAVAVVSQSGQSATGRGPFRAMACAARCAGMLQFSKVTFTYKGAASPALKDVAFEVPRRTTLRHHGPLRFRQDHGHAAPAAAAFQLRRA